MTVIIVFTILVYLSLYVFEWEHKSNEFLFYTIHPYISNILEQT